MAWTVYKSLDDRTLVYKGIFGTREEAVEKIHYFEPYVQQGMPWEIYTSEDIRANRGPSYKLIEE